MTRKFSFGNLLFWLANVVVALVVANAMIAGVLVLPAFLGGATAAGLLTVKILGWVIIVSVLLSAVLSFIK